MCLGIPGQIVEISNVEHKLAIVEVGGVRREVNIACIVDEGFAMSRIDEQEAKRTIELLTEMGEVQTELQAMRESNTS